MDFEMIINLVFVALIPALVVLTNIFTNIVKGFGAPFADHAAVVAPIVAELLTLLATIAYLDITGTAMTWYWIAGGIAVGGIVAYVAMNGYDGLYEDLLKHLHGLAGKSSGNVYDRRPQISARRRASKLRNLSADVPRCRSSCQGDRDGAR